jgi:hypothetical protein
MKAATTSMIGDSKSSPIEAPAKSMERLTKERAALDESDGSRSIGSSSIGMIDVVRHQR